MYPVYTETKWVNTMNKKIYVLIETNSMSGRGAVYGVYSTYALARAAKVAAEQYNVSYFYEINTFDLDG